MKFKHLLTGILIVTSAFGAMADLPFRNHRYDSFKATPVNSNAIVFYGNSITNMHEWWEAFGSDGRIINRGNSGGMSQELIDNLESVIDGKPAKLFLMIGTNDISTGIPYQTVVGNIGHIINRIQTESPATEIYIQSILPRAAEPQNTNNKAANAMLATLCEETGVTFIDLWDSLQGIRDYGQWSADGLHLYAAGYRVWCRQIAPYLGNDIKCVYEDSYANINGGMSNSNGMRLSYFGMLPVKSTDVLIVGDEMIHGGEWHELLRSDRIKDRGIGWGYGGLDISQHKTDLSAILTGNGNKETPAKIFFYCGTNDKSTSAYSSLLDEAKRLAPGAKLYVMSQIPLSNNSNSAVVSFNNSIKTIAESKGATYVDIYTPLLNASGNTDTDCISGNYLYGRGYIKVANVLAQYLEEEGVNPVSIEEFEHLYATRTTRSSLQAAIAKADALSFGDATGQYPEATRDLLQTVINQAEEVLMQPEINIEAANAAATALNNAIATVSASINMPRVSTESEVQLYNFCSTLRGSFYTSATSDGLIGQTSAGNTAECLWKFIGRADGTYDIVNYSTGQYIGTSAYNTQISLSATAPAKGWRLSYSDTPGMYTIYNASGSCQLNQTNASIGAKIYNWYTSGQMPDRTDQGCQFTITEFNGDISEPVRITTGWHEIKLANDLNGYVTNGTHHILNAENEYRQNNTNYYALRYAAPDPSLPATAFIHITVNGTTHQFTGLCGHGIQENCTSSRASLPTSNPAVAQSAIEGAWSIGKWNDYSNDGAESPYVGKSSGSNNSFFITPVDESVLAGFDIYKVTIKGVSNGAEVGLDTRIGLDIEANKGIRKVFNGGTFFVTKGTVLTYDDFSPEAKNGRTEPEITIDAANGSITVDYSMDHDPGSALTEVTADKSSETFDLLGRRMINPSAHGLYVIDGKKVCL